MSDKLNYCLIAALLNCSLLYLGCKEEETYVMTGEDSLRIKLTAISDSLEKEFSKRPPKYLIYKPKKAITYSRLVSKFGNRGAEIVLALNRVDKTDYAELYKIVDKYVNEERAKGGWDAK